MNRAVVFVIFHAQPKMRGVLWATVPPTVGSPTNRANSIVIAPIALENPVYAVCTA